MAAFGLYPPLTSTTSATTWNYHEMYYQPPPVKVRKPEDEFTWLRRRVKEITDTAFAV